MVKNEIAYAFDCELNCGKVLLDKVKLGYIPWMASYVRSLKRSNLTNQVHVTQALPLYNISQGQGHWS